MFRYANIANDLRCPPTAETMGEPGARQEVANERALTVYNRVLHKLTGMLFYMWSSFKVNDHGKTGRDFNPEVSLSVPNQVEKLISQATNLENLCQCFSGWYVPSHLVAVLLM